MTLTKLLTVNKYSTVANNIKCQTKSSSFLKAISVFNWKALTGYTGCVPDIRKMLVHGPRCGSRVIPVVFPQFEKNIQYS
jgi:hypothetical protein